MCLCFVRLFCFVLGDSEKGRVVMDKGGAKLDGKTDSTCVFTG